MRDWLLNSMHIKESTVILPENSEAGAIFLPQSQNLLEGELVHASNALVFHLVPNYYGSNQEDALDCWLWWPMGLPFLGHRGL